MYNRLLEELMRKHGFGCPQYSDETQLFVFSSSDPDRMSKCAFLVCGRDCGMDRANGLGISPGTMEVMVARRLQLSF